MLQLPLILACIFIFFMLRLDRKQYPEATYALWIPAIWMLLITSKGSIAVWFGAGGEMDEGNSLDRLLLSVLLIIALLILIKKRFNWANHIKDNSWLMVLICFTLVTVLWSDMPFVSFKRWIRWTISAVIMAFVVRTEVEPRQALLSVFRRVVYVNIPLSIIVVRFYGDLGRQYVPWSGDLTWIGVGTHKNALTALCVFAMFFLVWTFIRRWRSIEKPTTWYQTYLEVFIFLLAFYLFMGPQHSLTYSSTSLVCLVIGVATLLIFNWLKKRNIVLNANLISIFIGFIILFGTITPFMGHLPFFDVSEVLNRDSTLTGRADLWDRLVPCAKQNFLLGYGIGAFWSDLRIDEMRSMEAHNGYLDVILNYGLVGLILFSIFLLNSSRKAHREIIKNSDWGIFWFCVILMTLIQNIPESSLSPFTGLFRVALLLQICCQTGTQSKPIMETDNYASCAKVSN
ncbi:MAG: O-antigen ligase family protein [Desulfobacteraceae bacterium]|nr:MAG: O-antigen ligase family protein [Desulfobacteraceae bacterium]